MPHPADSKLKAIAADHGVVLLYHSIAEQAPEALTLTLHNTPPQILFKHIEDLSAAFTFVSLDEFSQAKEKRGLAAVSFDDGYANVLDNALPVLEALDCPAALFVNPVTLSGGWNWRDKVRYVIHHRLEQAFCRQFEFNSSTGRFYRYSKHPDNNSRAVDQGLDAFLAGRDIDLYPAWPYLSETDLAPDHRLIQYGNHSQNHYVLASLTGQQQAGEIEAAHQWLHEIKGLPLSRCFSAPFGGSADINEVSRDLVCELGYQCLLMSRQRLQPAIPKTDKVTVLERFMPKSADICNELLVHLYE